MFDSPVLLPNNQKPYRTHAGEDEAKLPESALFDKVINISIHRKDKPDIVIRSDYDLIIKNVHKKETSWEWENFTNTITRKEYNEDNWHIQKCTYKPSLQVKYTSLSANTSSEIDLIIHNFFLFTGEGNMSLYDFMEDTGDGNPTYPITGVDIVIGYASQFPKPKTPQEWLDVSAAKAPIGTSGIRINTITYCSYDSAPPNSVFRIHGYVASTERLEAIKPEGNISLLKPNETAKGELELKTAKDLFYNLVERRFIRDTISWEKARSYEGALEEAEEAEKAKNLQTFKEHFTIFDEEKRLEKLENKYKKPFFKVPDLDLVQKVSIPSTKDFDHFTTAKKIPRLKPNLKVKKRYIASDGYLDKEGAEKFGCKVIIPEASGLNKFTFQYKAVHDSKTGKLKSIGVKDFFATYPTVEATLDYITTNFFPKMKYTQLMNGNYIVWLQTDFGGVDTDGKEIEARVSKMLTSLNSSVLTQVPSDNSDKNLKGLQISQNLNVLVKEDDDKVSKVTMAVIPAVYSVAVSAGKTTIKCPFFQLLNPLRLISFNSRYNLADFARYYERGASNQVYFSVINYTVDFSTTGKENYMTILAKNAKFTVINKEGS